MKHTFIFILAILLTASCSTKKNDKHPIEKIDLTTGIEKIEKVNLSTITDDIECVKLETNDKCLVGNISRTMLKDSLIILKDDLEQLFIFNTKGKSLLKLNRKGQGPQEYTAISNFDVSLKNKLIYIHDGSGQKIIIYDFKGEFKRYKNIKGIYPSDLKIWNDSIIALIFPKDMLESSDFYRLKLYNSDIEFIKGVHKVKTEKINYSPNSVSWVRLIPSKSELTYWESLNDTVFTYDGNCVDSHFVFDAGKYQSSEMEKTEDPIKLSNKGKDIIDISSFRETPKYIFVELIIGRYGRNILYNKSKKSGSNIVFNYDFYDVGFHNDIDGGIPFWPKGQDVNTGALYDYISPYKLMKLMENPYFKTIKISNPARHKQLMSILNAAKLEDNPLFFIIKPN
jgi:hypothetical protein